MKKKTKAQNKVNINKQSKQNNYKERILNKNLCEILNDLLFMCYTSIMIL